MYAINAVLVFGAFFLALFAFLFVAGPLLQSVSLVTRALRALGRPRMAKAQVPQREPAARPAVPHTPSQDVRRALPAAPLSSWFPRRGSFLPESGWIKTAAAVLGAIAVGFVAIIVAEETASSVRAVASPTVQGVEAAAATAVSAADELRSAAGRLAPGAGEAIAVPASTPRECSPDQGVVTNCTYN